MVLFFLRLWKLGSENYLLPREFHAPNRNQEVDYSLHGGARPYTGLNYPRDYMCQHRTRLKYSKNGVWPVMLPIIRFSAPNGPGLFTNTSFGAPSSNIGSGLLSNPPFTMECRICCLGNLYKWRLFPQGNLWN
jgi:hypothetical protein